MAQVPLQQSAVGFPGGGQAAHMQSLGNLLHFRELGNIVAIEECQAAATQIRQRQALNLMAKLIRQLEAGGLKRRGGQGRNVGVDPFLIVSGGKAEFSKALDGRVAKLGQPRRSMLVKRALQAAKACEISSFLFFKRIHQIPDPFPMSNSLPLSRKESAFE